MTLKAIKEHFKVIGEKGVYNLYDPNPNSSKYSNNRYLCTIHYNSKTEEIKIVELVNPTYDKVDENGNIVTIQRPYAMYIDRTTKNDDINHFAQWVFEFANKLPYPSDFYDPLCRKVSNLYRKIDYYLKSIGFTNTHFSFSYGYDVHDYVLNNIHPYSKSIGSIALSIKFNEKDNDDLSGDIIMDTGHSGYVTKKFDGLDEAIASINAIVEPILLNYSSKALSTYDKLTDSRANLSETEMVHIDYDSLNTYTENMRDKTIAALENALNMLKNMR